LPTKHNRYTVSDINQFPGLKKINKFFYLTDLRHRNIKNITFYWNLLKKIKRQNPDIVYLNLQGFPFLAPICGLLLNKKQIIFAVHQAQVHEGMKFQLITKLYFKFLHAWFNHFHLFSDSQAEIFKQKHPNKNVNVIPLGLKHFGQSDKVPSNDKIVFFNFGTIIKNKNIGILIEAACNLYEKGISNFKVRIVGACENWTPYESLIKYPELFELKIEAIENDEIPELFSSSHYLVLPYSAVSQSGPLKIAFNYNNPVIASNLEEFRNEIKDNVTGYLFKNSDVKSLEETMLKAISNHNRMYERLKTNQREYVINNYSTDIIKENYNAMFNSIGL
jgi:glycosyltransferase involved in cell wall biosynthesis